VILGLVKDSADALIDVALARYCETLGVPPESLRNVFVIGWRDGTQ
jgi:hypothetical protein